MKRRGMTLLEVVIALVITAFTATAGVESLGFLVDRRTAAADAVRETTRASGVRRTLMTWLEGVRLVPGDQGRSFQLVDRTSAGRPDDELTFITTAPTPIAGENTIVRLYVEHDVRSPVHGLVAELRDWAGTHVTTVLVDSTVTSLDVRCRTAAFGTPQWLGSWLSAGLLPRGIELRLGSSGPVAPHPLLALPFAVAFQGGL